MLSFLLKQWSKYIYNFKTSWLKNRKSNALENRKMDKENQEEETPMAENPKQWLPLPWGLDPQAEPGIGRCAGRCGSGLSCYGAVFVCPVVRMCPRHRRACVPRGSVALLLHIYLGSCCVCQGHGWGSLWQQSGDGLDVQWFRWQDFPPEDSGKVIHIP